MKYCNNCGTQLDDNVQFCSNCGAVQSTPAPVNNGYTANITGSVASGYVVTNSHVPAKTEVSGSKTWNDEDDHDGFRPESITFQLWQTIDGVTGEEPYATATTDA